MEMNVNFIGKAAQGLIIPDIETEKIEDVMIVIRTKEGSYTIRLTDLQTSTIVTKCLMAQTINLKLV
ncbi:hypothetical protein ACYJ80_10690 [Staphylococcus capitis]|uniref:Uncharacterized protein n=3 Tax=Staphylococcus TaxID=1279 RepID=Q5HMH7_STAEQ|nr:MULTISPECIES: hypothetical protein [Staphylococcus]YP_009226741.1 hypothetical protein AXJ01_gp065 [Staphylococcus phage SPbeta-like]EON79539.1 hypothetical protein H700_13737 [Staphylococcus epidermidis 41tr]EON79577.1 hypothetical protein H701_13942 [Staphylococcus epidermidis 528m]EON85121.1 hypothetical protein D592_12492 [Staphylococcus epidermidis 36-1]KKD21718.1 hypothetical protein XA21_11630 [Staphylococcus cohnii subsp. cohnii]QPB07820.1 hypothetical protein PLKLOBMN_00249 [Staph